MKKDWPVCLVCGKPLPREIKETGMHHRSCPWNYYIECSYCGYQNSLSKLLGFWSGCSKKCRGPDKTITILFSGFSLN